jgi:hypothetical protein
MIDFHELVFNYQKIKCHKGNCEKKLPKIIVFYIEGNQFQVKFWQCPCKLLSYSACFHVDKVMKMRKTNIFQCYLPMWVVLL